ncbi:histidine--tRNA ligase [Candidatus Saccharibacteria bacterium]|nr:histidine--tRNA ligase [Candidatus Saccharibacteria bacterium]
MTTLSTRPYKGTRDYYPEEKRLQNYIFSVWAQAARQFGYEEYGAPLLEPLDIYTAKSGQELASEQTYVFDDRGGRTVAVRPEMTPSVSRMVAARRQELAMPARLYSIANFMRYERPQRGREREFWQMNVDLFGVSSIEADAEIIELAYTSMKLFGAKDDMFTIRVNDRELINAIMFRYLGCDAVQAELMIKLLDRKHKISTEAFRDQAVDIFGPEQAKEGLPKLASLLGVYKVTELPLEIQQHPAAERLQQLMDKLAQAGVRNVLFDASLMRGLDYYTGTVFEVFDTHPDNNRALFGGGRYDGLVSLFGVEPLPTVGMGLGATTMQNFLEVHKLVPQDISTTDVYLVVIGESALRGAKRLARELRAEGVRVEVDITERKLDKQLRSALKKHIPYLVFVGEAELQSGHYKIKNTATAQEQVADIARMVSIVLDRRSRRDELDDIIASLT